MKSAFAWLWLLVALVLNTISPTFIYAHDTGGGSSSKDLTRVPFAPNPNVPEFANAQGTLLLNLATGVIQLEDLQGFPFDVAQNRILPTNVTVTTDPRLKGHDGELGDTSCTPAGQNTNEAGEQEPVGPWTCHVHSYAVWLAELEDGALGHPLPLGTVYPRTDGTAAERNFSFREGDLSGFGANVVILTAEVTFGPLPSLAGGHDGHSELQLAPQGPIVLQANLP